MFPILVRTCSRFLPYCQLVTCTGIGQKSVCWSDFYLACLEAKLRFFRLPFECFTKAAQVLLQHWLCRPLTHWLCRDKRVALDLLVTVVEISSMQSLTLNTTLNDMGPRGNTTPALYYHTTICNSVRGAWGNGYFSSPQNYIWVGIPRLRWSCY